MSQPVDDEISVQGIRPGQTRSDVLSLLGPPLGDGLPGELPRVLRPNRESAPVWRYEGLAVFFDQDTVLAGSGQPLAEQPTHHPERAG